MIFSMFYGTQRSTLGLLTLDVLMREELELPGKVTQYPVEDGGPEISDHITQGNELLKISGSVSSSSIEAFDLGACTSRMMDAIETLREMHAERDGFTVVTGLGVYEDKGFDGITISRGGGDEKGGAWLDIDAKLVRIIKVSLEEAELPPDKVSETAPGAKGKAGATEKKSGSSASGKQKTPPSDGIYKSQFVHQGIVPPGVTPA